MAQLAEEAEAEEKKESIFTLKCQNNSRRSGLCIIPALDTKFANIVKIIRDEYDRGNRVIPHIHLIFPFLPVDSFNDIVEILTHCIASNKELRPFMVHFQDLCRTHGTGKQYCYLQPTMESQKQLVHLQECLMNALCEALNNGTAHNKNQQSITAPKQKQKQKQKRKQKRGKAEAESADKTCLQTERRNVEFNPHLSVGQMNEKEFKQMRNMVLSAFDDIGNSHDTDMDTNDGKPLFPKILHFKVENVYLIIAKKGQYNIAKTIALNSIHTNVTAKHTD